MTDKDATTPRVYLARHGETEWSKNGRYTGITELSLTDNGVQQVTGISRIFVGPNKLNDASNLAHIFCSPRRRAQQTLALLFGDAVDVSTKTTTTEEIAEWGYGKYEGLKTEEIRERRREQGLDRETPWDIWRDGCEDGESTQEVSDRLDGLIKKIHAIQQPHLHDAAKADVLLVAHGLILRAFTKRWLNLPLATPLAMLIEPGGIGALSYAHNSIDEPNFLLGLALPTEKK